MNAKSNGNVVAAARSAKRNDFFKNHTKISQKKVCAKCGDISKNLLPSKD